MTTGGKHRLIICALLPLFTLSWLASCKRSTSGGYHHALSIVQHYRPVKKGINRVNPYEINIMALNLLQEVEDEGFKKLPEEKANAFILKRDSFITECQLYIRWYLNHLNISDRYGLTATIYDYDIHADGTEQMVKEMNHIDRRAASFILLLYRFYKITGYRQMIIQSRKKIEDIAYLIPYLQDNEDGLVRALPHSNRKYLENNCFDYAAMDAFAHLISLFGWQNEQFYKDVRESVKHAVLTHLYRSNRGQFYRMADGTGIDKKKYAADLNSFYPDAYSHLFPILYDIIPANEIDKKYRLWQTIHRFHHPGITKQPIVRPIVYRWTALVVGDRQAAGPTLIKDLNRYYK
jgi:hypothetical protein